MLVASVCVILCLGALNIVNAVPIQNGATDTNPILSPSTSHPVTVCRENTRCGWAIYVPFTRTIDHYLKNTCECPENYACLRTDDHLSMHAYVYRCKPRPAVTTIDLTPTNICYC